VTICNSNLTNPGRVLLSPPPRQSTLRFN